jgi:RNA polymerase sigma factor FliA
LHAAVELADPKTRAPADDEAMLWRACRIEADANARARLIERHIDFARIMAGKLYARRITDEVAFDEYMQLASLALIECVDRYDPARGAGFRTFASYRISGAILTGLASLSERAQQIALRSLVKRDRLASLHDRTAFEGQDAFERLAATAVGLAIGFALDDLASLEQIEGVCRDSAYDHVTERQTRERLMKRVGELPQREALVIRYHYLQQIPFEQIATMLELTKGRVSQIHRKALELLRHALQHTDGLDLSL